jgi:hypothetical protein
VTERKSTERARTRVIPGRDATGTKARLGTVGTEEGRDLKASSSAPRSAKGEEPC